MSILIGLVAGAVCGLLLPSLLPSIFGKAPKLVLIIVGAVIGLGVVLGAGSAAK